MSDFAHSAEAGYQVAKLTSEVMRTTREMLALAGVAPNVVEQCLHATYTLAYLDGVGRGLNVAIEATR